MPTIGNLHISLCSRCAVPTSPTLRFAPLLPRCHARIPLRHARIPLVVSRPSSSSTTASSSTLVVSGELKRFPLCIGDFREVREPGSAYFDRTKYIPELQNEPNVQLICRPRRFGKSLTITMLRYFHGFQFREQYDELFKVCGTPSGHDLHAHIAYAKFRVSTSIKLSKMAKSSLDGILSWSLTSPTSSVLPKLPILWSSLGKN
jgi:Predicted AAA-ATPase